METSAVEHNKGVCVRCTAFKTIFTERLKLERRSSLEEGVAQNPKFNELFTPERR